MGSFFNKINMSDFETLTLSIVNNDKREIGFGTYPVEAVMTYDTMLDIDFHGTSFLIDCTDITYDSVTEAYTVNDHGVVFKIML